MRHTITALVQDHPGTLSRVTGLFRRRGYNIESLVVGPSETPGQSRLTAVVEAAAVEPVLKQLRRLIEVLHAEDVTGERAVHRETALLRVQAAPAERAVIVGFCNVMGARILDVGIAGLVLEVSGEPRDVDRFIALVEPFGLLELTRTGRIAMTRAAPETAARRTARPALLALDIDYQLAGGRAG